MKKAALVRRQECSGHGVQRLYKSVRGVIVEDVLVLAYARLVRHVRLVYGILKASRIITAHYEESPFVFSLYFSLMMNPYRTEAGKVITRAVLRNSNKGANKVK